MFVILVSMKNLSTIFLNFILNSCGFSNSEISCHKITSKPILRPAQIKQEILGANHKAYFLVIQMSSATNLVLFTLEAI
jgi:hypothetical protein